MRQPVRDLVTCGVPRCPISTRGRLRCEADVLRNQIKAKLSSCHRSWGLAHPSCCETGVPTREYSLSRTVKSRVFVLARYCDSGPFFVLPSICQAATQQDLGKIGPNPYDELHGRRLDLKTRHTSRGCVGGRQLPICSPRPQRLVLLVVALKVHVREAHARTSPTISWYSPTA